ncbi:MAG: hypothetical protein JNM30_07615 [Rhodospirillales bacterium]|nr:hypothetical protein [Rhodospirillales bacterium]
MSDPRTPRREDEREDDKGLDGDLPRGRRPRPGIDAPEIDRRRVRPEDEDRNQPDDPRVS